MALGRLQFTTRQLLVAMFLLCLGAAILGWAINAVRTTVVEDRQAGNELQLKLMGSVLASTALCGAGIGALVRRPGYGAVIALALLIGTIVVCVVLSRLP
jgi:hypothetical protein